MPSRSSPGAGVKRTATLSASRTRTTTTALSTLSGFGATATASITGGIGGVTTPGSRPQAASSASAPSNSRARTLRPPGRMIRGGPQDVPNVRPIAPHGFDDPRGAAVVALSSVERDPIAVRRPGGISVVIVTRCQLRQPVPAGVDDPQVALAVVVIARRNPAEGDPGPVGRPRGLHVIARRRRGRDLG